MPDLSSTYLPLDLKAALLLAATLLINPSSNTDFGASVGV